MLVEEYKFPIAGFEPTSLIDFPDGQFASVLFLGGCNFRCGYCHNPELILTPTNWVSIASILHKLKTRRKWINSLVISGGEPLIHTETLLLIEVLVKNGYKIKLDTNGSFPENLQYLVDRNYLECVALDIKTSFDRYQTLASNKISEKILRSIRILQDARDLDIEFRTTLCPSFVSLEEMVSISSYINGETWYWQQFNPLVTLDPEFSKIQPYSRDQILEFKKMVEFNFTGQILLRGV